MRLFRWPGVLLAACASAGAGTSAPEPPPDIDYMIVVTGGELLAGEFPDGHTHFLTRTLRPMGLHCVGSMTVDDRRPEIEAALKFACAKAPLVIVTGGLGPTDNDVTRETLEAFTGIALVESETVLSAMERRLDTPRDQMRANLRKQARVPSRGTCLMNANGTAVGLVFEMGEKVIVALPGPPRELEPMARDQLAPYLGRRFGTHPPGCSLTVRFVGLGQSAIDQVLDERVALPKNAILGSRFDGSRVDFTFAMPHDTAGEKAQLDSLKENILRHLGDSIYGFGEDSLEDVVLSALRADARALVIAEIGSGGALAAALNAARGADGVVAAAFSAPSAERLRSMLGIADDAWRGRTSAEDRARSLADAAATAFPGAWTIVTGEKVTDPSGAHTVPVALRSPDGRLECLSLGSPGTDTAARAALVTQSLDHLRRRIRRTGD